MNECKFCCTEMKKVSVEKEGQCLLSHIDLHIHCDEILALLGPNGAGKTTLFKTLLGEMPYTGDIIHRIHEGEVHMRKPIIGYVPQHLTFDLTSPLTLLDLFGACMQKKPIWYRIDKQFKKEVELALEEVQLGYALERRIGLLSGGELQRALLALALRPKPDLLLLDEPVSGVDVNGQTIFYDLVKGLKEKYHMAIVLITHELGTLEEKCDRAVLLNKEILATGDPAYVKEEAIRLKQFKMR